eukprot:3835895-Amphidinium_carterae.4
MTGSRCVCGGGHTGDKRFMEKCQGCGEEYWLCGRHKGCSAVGAAPLLDTGAVPMGCYVQPAWHCLL